MADKMDAIKAYIQHCYKLGKADGVKAYKGLERTADGMLDRMASDFEILLRCSDWVHLDDKVEGKGLACDHILDCPDYKAPCDTCEQNRPPTIRDLLQEVK